MPQGATTAERPKSPPKARLAFRVGVVGHRPDRLQNADHDRLKELIHQILTAVRDEVESFQAESAHAGLFSEEPPVLRAITPLAEGADRIFANEALQLGYELCCPFPFPQAEYEVDFQKPASVEENSVENFHSLLMKAESGAGLTTFELDGVRGCASDAYGAAGRIVLNQSDLLVVVWDGEPPKGPGGTVDTLKEAVRFRVPVLWIDAVAPHLWQMLKAPEDLQRLKGPGRCVPVQSTVSVCKAVRQVVRGEIAPPRPSETASGKKSEVDPVAPETYFAERKRLLQLAFLWKLFRNLVGSNRLSWPNPIVKDYESQLSAKWPTNTGTETARWVNTRLRPHYAWADKLADRYADAYRSAYVFIYLAAAFAVFLALLPMAAGWEGRRAQALCVAGELVIMGMITWVLSRESRQCWHRRWMAYRLLAELIRQLKCLIPLGGARPLPRMPEHLKPFGDPAGTWMFWQFRAIARATGIPGGSVTRDYLRECLENMNDLVIGHDGQLDFHSKTHKRCEKLSHRLHLASLWMFRLTLCCIAIHLVPHISRWLGKEVFLPAAFEGWLTLLCATLPAFGSAMAGISNQGEFVRIAKRSESMKHAFERFQKRIDTLAQDNAPGKGPVRLSQVTPLAEDITQLMVDEVVEWRIIFIDRPATA